MPSRLSYGTFNSTEPSTTTDYRVVSAWIEETKENVDIEVWDFPGRISPAQRNVLLMSNFFHAAIICYSIESNRNLENLASVVSDVP